MVARTSFHFDDRTYQQFLHDQLAPNRSGDLNAHLEQCSECQARLEELARGDTSWEDIRAGLSREDASTPTREFNGSEDPTENDSDADGHHRFAPSFLEATDADNSLGRFGRYEIEDVIGCGGMGVVLKGYDSALNRYSAIKVLAPTLATSAAARRRFSREAQSAAAVVHDHVVPIHTVDEERDLPYFVMPLIDGQSLEQRVADRGPLSVPEVLRIGMQVAAGLAAAHAQGLVHRDVKPGNIMLENGVDRVMITDFGLARAVDDAQVTQSGVIAGTPRYMSPEQARGESLDHRSDLFSLGSVLYFMATGHSPFRSQTTMGVLRRILDETPRPVRESNPEMPAWLDGLIAKLLAKTPNDRFQSADEVRDLLASWLAYLQSPATVAKPPSPTPPVLKTAANPPNRWRVRNWLIAAGFAGAILLAGIVLIAKIGETTVRFEIDDPNLAVRFGANEITVDNDDQKIHIRPGKSNQFVVVQGGVEIVGSSFQLKRGEKVVLRVHSSDGKVKVESGPRITIDPRPAQEQLGQAPPANQHRANQQPTPGYSTNQQSAAADIYRQAVEKRANQQPFDTRFEWKPSANQAGEGFEIDLLGYHWYGRPKARITAKPFKVIPTLASVTQLAFSPDGKRFATTAGDGLGLFDGQSGEAQGFIRMQHGSISNIAFSTDGRYLASASDDGAVRIWDPANRTSVGDGIPGSKFQAIVFAAADQLIASDRGAPLTFWSVPAFKKQKTLHGLPTTVDQLVISRSGKLLAAIESTQPNVRAWSLDTGEVMWSVDHESRVRGVQFAPDGGSFVTGGDNGEIRCWKATQGAALWRTQGDARAKVEAIQWTPDSTAVIYGLSNGTIGLLDGRTGQTVQTFKAHTGPVDALAISPDGKTMVSSGRDEGALKLWRLQLGYTIEQAAGGVYRPRRQFPYFESQGAEQSKPNPRANYPAQNPNFGAAKKDDLGAQRDPSQSSLVEGRVTKSKTSYVVDLLLAVKQYERAARQYENSGEQKQRIIEEAAKRYGEIASKYRTNLAGLLARIHEARCHQQLGQFERAKALASEVVKVGGVGPNWDSIRYHARSIVESCEKELTKQKKSIEEKRDPNRRR